MTKSRASIIEPKWFLIFVFFLAGVFLGGTGIYIWFGENSTPISKLHSTSSHFKYINPVLTVDINQGQNFSVNNLFKLGATVLIKKYQNAGNIFSASVYFRDIEPAYWAGIDENTLFSPGRLLKIPIMIAYYKIAEHNPESLNRKLAYKLSGIANGNPLETTPLLKEGEEYTIEELIRNMVVYSDNNAADLLFDNIDKTYLNEVFSDLGINFMEEKQAQDFISLKAYGLFFRVLYNASYLDRDYSEKALALLDETSTDVGLASTLPKALAIANRYGARVYNESGKEAIQMYDCNLVYYPSHAYLLCAVASGQNLLGVEQFFEALGKEGYKQMSFRYPQ